jgi:hypothetical protein
MSAKTGQGFEALTELLGQTGGFGRKILDIDYDTYAEGEAELGWLNSSVLLTAETPFELDDLLMAVTRGLHGVLAGHGGEVAHLKVIGLDDGGAFGVANMVSNDTPPVLSLASNTKPRQADLIVNARVAIDPAVLEAEVQRVVRAECAARGVTPEFRQTQSLRPGRPTPTHRYSAAVQ